MAIRTENTAIFDSSGLISLLITSDSNYPKARSILKLAQKKGFLLILPVDTFSETINIIGKKFGHLQAVKIAHFILSNPKFLLTEMVSYYENSLEKLQKSSQSVSFTDCVVMAAADANQTKFIFGFDKVFSQQGYSLPQ